MRPDIHGFGTRSVLAAQDEGSTSYRDTCGKCGAIRQDRQIGLESSLDAYIACHSDFSWPRGDEWYCL